MNTYSPFSIIRGVIILAFIWPAMIYLGVKSWRVKKGYAQRTPIDGGIAIVVTRRSIPFTIALYLSLAAWWYLSV